MQKMSEKEAIEILRNTAIIRYEKETGLWSSLGDAMRTAIQALEEIQQYRQMKEQGRLLILPCAVGDVVDKLFSHNEIVALWIEKKEEISYHELVWNGMAWDIPEVFKSCRFIKMFGTIPMAISEADHINIEVSLSEEAEAALEKMKGEEHE